MTDEQLSEILKRSSNRYLMDDGIRWAVSDGDKLLAEIYRLREQLSQPLHASARAGYKCIDCALDAVPCPSCYTAWWRERHPRRTPV